MISLLLGALRIVAAVLGGCFLSLFGAWGPLVTEIRTPGDFCRTWYYEPRSLTRYFATNSSRVLIDMSAPFSERVVYSIFTISQSPGSHLQMASFWSP